MNTHVARALTTKHQYQQLQQQELRFEQRFDTVIAQLQQERAAAGTLRASLLATREQATELHAEIAAVRKQAAQECRRLQVILTVKQGVITLLLPFYPHPLSPSCAARLICAKQNQVVLRANPLNFHLIFVSPVISN